MVYFDFKELDKMKERIKLEESWDKELHTLRKNRESVAFWKKEQDKKRKEMLKRRNPGE